MALSYSESRQIAARYAQAAFALAKDAQQEEAVCDCLLPLKEAMESDAALRRTVRSPVIAAGDKQQLFSALLDRLDAAPLARQLVHTVLVNRRAELLPLIASAFRERLDTNRGILRVQVQSAQALDKDRLGAIETAMKSALEGDDIRDIRLSGSVDPALIGGLRITCGSRRLDASIAGRLNRLAIQLKQVHAA